MNQDFFEIETRIFDPKDRIAFFEKKLFLVQ